LRKSEVTLLSRRGFVRTGLAAAGAALAATPLASPCEAAAAAPLATQELGPQLFLITGGGGNVLAQGSPEGALLIDGGARNHSAALLKLALRAVNAAKVHTLVNTHWHPDQTGSNETLGRQGARIIAHENTRLWLTRKIVVDWAGAPFAALPKIAQPNKSFYTTEALVSGDEQISLGHLGQAHTDGDIHVYLPKANVLVAGGVVSAAGWPLLDWQTGGWIGGLVGAQDRLLKIANDRTRIVPANGPIITRQDLQAQRAMYFAIYDRLIKQLVKGMGPDEAYASGPAREFEAQWGDSKQFVLAAFRSLWGHFAPDA
jgi:glyoxylase-like metal-dependent hydrolase (beta-lactamase superfamily II)